MIFLVTQMFRFWISYELVELYYRVYNTPKNKILILGASWRLNTWIVQA